MRRREAHRRGHRAQALRFTARGEDAAALEVLRELAARHRLRARDEPALPDLSATTPTAAAPGGIGLYGFASPGGAVRFGALSVVAG